MTYYFRLSMLAIGCLLTACVGPSQVSAEIPTVEIYKPDGSRQCEQDSGIPLSEMGQTLTTAGIPVLSSRRDHDCFSRAALCGTGTGVINVYEISEHQLPDAQTLGFIPYGQLRARCEPH